jgi:hypothetical protein
MPFQKGNKLRSGRKHSEETKQKISITKKGNVHIPQVIRDQISKKLKGRIVSEETRERISKYQKGRKHSETHCKNLSGEKNGMWKGGRSYEPYCPKFNPEFKERVRAFFKYICQVCGHVWRSEEHKLAVHHIKYNKKACCDDSPRLFIPVCFACHMKTNYNRKYWDELLTQKILLEYDGVCY